MNTSTSSSPRARRVATPVAEAPLRGQPAQVPAVVRALALLEQVARQREGLTLARLALELGYPKSSVHGLCGTLQSLGYLRRRADGAYVIGPSVMGLAEAFVAGTQVADEFNALWQERGGAHDETIILSVLNGAEVVYVAARPGRRPLGLAFNVGMRLPAHLAATGKAMLAWLSEEQIDALFPSDPLPCMSAVRGQGAATRAALRRELRATRERGHSIDDEGIREGVYCMGAPVFDTAGRPVAGVGVCINKSLLGSGDEARHREVVLGAARELTRRIGGRPPQAARKDSNHQGDGA